MNQGILSIKLYELEQQYGKTQSRLRLCCGQKDHEKIRRELSEIEEEYEENDILLRKNAENSRSPAVSALAGAQFDFFRRAEEILREKLPQYLHSDSTDVLEESAEACALYAEYAVDFAAQSMRYALISALRAIDAQMKCEESAAARQTDDGTASLSADSAQTDSCRVSVICKPETASDERRKER